MSAIGCGSTNGTARREGSQLCSGFLFTKMLQLSRQYRCHWYPGDWPSGVIGTFSLPLAIFGSLLQYLHQCPPGSLLPAWLSKPFFLPHLAPHIHPLPNLAHMPNPRQPYQSASSTQRTRWESALSVQLSAILVLEYSLLHDTRWHSIVPLHLKMASRTYTMMIRLSLL